MLDWPIETIEDCLLRLPLGAVRKLQTRDYRPAGRYPVVDQGQGLIAGWTDDGRGLISTDLPVIVFGDHTRTLKYVDFPFVRGADGTQILKPRPGLNPLYFFYALRAIKLPSRGYNRHFKELQEKEISIPPDTEEQRQIANVLKVIDDAILLQDEELSSLDRCRRAAIRALFTRGLRGEPQKETEIGPMPENWVPRPLLDLREIWSGGTPRKADSHYWNGDVPWVSGKDLKSPALDDVADHITQGGLESGSRLAPADSVLILVRGMGLARDLPVAVIRRPMAFNQDVKALVSRGDTSGSFLRSAIYFGKDRLLSKIVPSAHGTMTLNLNDIETFKIPWPADPNEADEIVSVIDTIDHKIDLHRDKHMVLRKLFRALLHKLMTGEVRVSDLFLAALEPASSSGAAV